MAANAFARGACDFYTGALPQEARLLYSSEFKGQFIAAAPHQAFGPGKTGVIFYSTFATSKTWLDQNQETAKKLIAIWFRASRYLKEKPSIATPIIARVTKVSTGGVFPPQTVQNLTSTLLTFATIQEARELYFSPKSPWYYPGAVEMLFKQSQQQGVAPKGVRAEDSQAVEPLFKEGASGFHADGVHKQTVVVSGEQPEASQRKERVPVPKTIGAVWEDRRRSNAEIRNLEQSRGGCRPCLSVSIDRADTTFVLTR